jgi:hypothetical protein
MSRLLIDEYPMMVLPSLSNKIGLEAAIVLQQINYWLRLNQEAERTDTFKDGHWWILNTIEEWQAKQFTWWSVSTVKRILSSLENMGLVISGRFNKNPYDHTKAYTINYTAVERLSLLDISCVTKTRTEIIEAVKNFCFGESNLTQPTDSDRDNRSGQFDPIEEVSLKPSEGSVWSDLLYSKKTKENIYTEDAPDGALSTSDSDPSLSTNVERSSSTEITSVDLLMKQMVDLYNETPPCWSNVRILDDDRKKKLRSFIKKHGDDAIKIWTNAISFIKIDPWWSSPVDPRTNTPKKHAFETLFTKSHLIEFNDKYLASNSCTGDSSEDGEKMDPRLVRMLDDIDLMDPNELGYKMITLVNRYVKNFSTNSNEESCNTFRQLDHHELHPFVQNKTGVTLYQELSSNDRPRYAKFLIKLLFKKEII